MGICPDTDIDLTSLGCLRFKTQKAISHLVAHSHSGQYKIVTPPPPRIIHCELFTLTSEYIFFLKLDSSVSKM